MFNLSVIHFTIQGIQENAKAKTIFNYFKIIKSVSHKYNLNLPHLFEPQRLNKMTCIAYIC